MVTIQPRILLLQARLSDDPNRKEERSSFARMLQMPLERVRTYDLLEGPPSLTKIRQYDALMMGGSGDFYVSKGDLPEFPKLLELLAEVVALGFPTFCSCFGFQCLVAALGGEIVYDAVNIEVGTYPLRLTEQGRRDPLIGSLPPEFLAQMGRKDRAIRLPEGVPNLATSERCRFQALRIPEKPIWATQFHPELDRETNLGRFRHYMEGYAAHLSEEERERALDRFVDSPETADLLAQFVELVFDHHPRR